MGHLLTRTQIQRLVAKHGREVIEHRHMQIERCCYQHGNVTTFEHSVRVACLAVWMAHRAHLWYRVDLKSLIRAALLHDYFLYDWHDWDNGEHQWHGFTHGHAALVNALKDFKLNDIERKSIQNHMFPITPVPPRYIEGYLVDLGEQRPPPPRPSRSTVQQARVARREALRRDRSPSMIITLEHYFLWFLFYSFVGWMYESILVSCQQHRLVNRGFLNGPLCPIYGTGAILGVALILGNVHNPIIIFLISMVGATILEYTTSWVMEQLFHARWWDYSNFRFNLQGRVCLLGALIFRPRRRGRGTWFAAICRAGHGYDSAADAAYAGHGTGPDHHHRLGGHGCGHARFERVLDSVSQVVQDVAARAGGTWQWGSSAVSDRMREAFAGYG